MTDNVQRAAAPPFAPTGSARTFPSVDWGAVVAGTAIATAISLILAAFGAGIGLSLASRYSGSGPFQHTIAVALWVLWVTVTSYAAGGYVAARLRASDPDMPKEDAEIRDGAHGLVTWATAIAIVALAAGPSLYSLGKAGVLQGGGQTSEYLADKLLRGAGGGGQSNAAPNAGQPREGGVDQATRRIVQGVIAKSETSGGVSPEDRSYLVNLLTTQTGLAPPEAEQRVDALAQRLREDSANEKQRSESDRRTGIVTSFIAAAAMFLGAASAWGGAILGGRHRDENVGLSRLARW